MADPLERLKRQTVDHVALVDQTDLSARIPIEHEKARIPVDELLDPPCAFAAPPDQFDLRKAFAKRIEHVLDQIGEAVMLGQIGADIIGDLHVAGIVRGRLDDWRHPRDRALTHAQH